MATTTIYADRIQIIDSAQPTTPITADTISTGQTTRAALIHFSFPSSLQFRRVSKIEFFFYSSPYGGYAGFVGTLRYLRGAFDSSTTWNTAPAPSYPTQKDTLSGSNTSSGYASRSLTSSSRAFAPHDSLNYGFYVEPGAGLGATMSTSLTSNPPYVIVTYADTDSYGYLTGSPGQNAYAPKNTPTTFRYSYTAPTNVVADPPTVASWKFNYRLSASGSFTAVNVGAAPSYTTPANLFASTDDVYWFASATLSTGQTINSGTYHLTTVEPVFSATAIAPDNTIEDETAGITFVWSAANSVGSEPSGAELQISTDGGNTWTALASVTGSETRYTAPVGSVPGGQVMWRVRALNSAGTAGAWSEALTFLCIAAPAAPSVSSNAAPFTTISWTADGQQAYEVTVDGVSYGVKFGQEKSLTLPKPLADGPHTATVRIQGAYGLWSQPGEVIFTVTNVPAGTVDLVGQFGQDAELVWSSNPAGDDFLIFRDGVLIGHTAGSSSEDRRALGSHEWVVLLRQADGNYTKSNTVIGTVQTEGPVIAPLKGGPWISLRLTDNQIRVTEFAYSRSHVLRHFSGSVLPVLELSPYVNRTVSLRCAFATQAEGEALEALYGQVVVLKADDTVTVGGLVNVSKSRNPFYLTYQFTIEQIAEEEIVDDTDA